MRFTAIALAFFFHSFDLSAQTVLYDKGGIRLSYSTSELKAVFCNKENKDVHFIKGRWELYNYSGKSLYISLSMNMTANSSIGSCVAEDQVVQFIYESPAQDTMVN